ncbi:MAG: hypothetical protein AAB738_03525 [Patescibacteria group bacterium]
MKKYIFLLAGISIFAFGVSAAHAQFAAGDRVWTTATLNVRSFPSTASGTVLGTQPAGALGNIVSGPVSGSGYTWWNVNYDNPPDGWSVGSYLEKVVTSSIAHCGDVNKDGQPNIFDLNIIIDVAFNNGSSTYVTDVNGSGATDVFDVNDEINYLFSGGPEPTGCVTVVNMPPVINSFTGPTSVYINTINYWQVAVTDPEGGLITNSVSWGASGTLMTYDPNVPSGQIRSYPQSYTTPGNYTITLRATDSGGLTTSANKLVTVLAATNQPPVINSFTGPTSLTVGQSGTWYANATDPEGANLSYYFYWDGACSTGSGCNGNVNSGATTNASHAFSTTGSHTILFNVFDGAGGSDSRSVTVNVSASSTTPVSPKIYPTKTIAPVLNQAYPSASYSASALQSIQLQLNNIAEQLKLLLLQL